MIRYKIIPKKNPQTKAVKYYAQPVRAARVEQRALVQEIAEQSALTTADVKACLDRLQYVVIHHLLEGQNVKLDDLGTFSFSLTSKGTDTEKDFKSAQVKHVRVQFLPSPELKKKFNVAGGDVQFEVVRDKDNDKTQTGA